MKYSKFAVVTLMSAMLLSGCNSVTSGDVVMTVGDVKVTENEFKYYIDSYNENFDYGKAKETSLEYCEKNAKIMAVATAMGLDISNSERSVESEKETLKASLGGEKAYKEYLKKNNISDDYMTNLITTNIYAELLTDKMDNVEITDEDKKAYFNENYRNAQYFRMLKANDETDVALKEKADEYVKRLDGGESFETIFGEAFEAKLADSNISGVFTDNENDIEYENAVDAVDAGKATVMEDDTSLYVIQRLPLNDADYENEASDIENIMQEKYFNEQLDSWAEEYEIKTTINQDVLDKIE